MTEYEQTTIEAFHARHGNIYDYSKVTCRKKQDKITIGCPTHGYFTQTVKHHARGDGCPQCFPSKRGNNRRMSQEEYVQKCKVAHNNKFDYSKTVYTGGQNSVIIICPIHGEFTQNAGTHASGSGCFRCGRLLIAKGSLKNTDYFITKSKTRQGDVYDYSKVVYVDTFYPVIITCRKHGDFKQRPFDHYAGKGCPKCGADRRIQATRSDPEMILNKIKNIYGDRFDYSKFNYINDDTKVTLICPIHGDFDKPYRGLLRGIGCSQCHHDSISLTTEQFVIRSNASHDYFYDYSKSVCSRGSDKVIIGCPVHGEFTQNALAHASGVGCKACSTDRVRVTLEEFKERSTKKHNGKYSYDKSVLENVSEKITITCPTHGDFRQIASAHMSGRICSKCRYAMLSYSEEEYKAMVTKVHGENYGLDNLGYVTLDHPVHVECQKHGRVKIKKAHYLLRGSGCSKCSGSNPEKLIGGYLEGFGILYDREFVIEGYRYRYDFLLIDYQVLIEYHGEQHYRSVLYYGGDEALIKRQAADEEKVKLARKNGYKLIVLNYKDKENGKLKESLVKALITAGVKLEL